VGLKEKSGIEAAPVLCHDPGRLWQRGARLMLSYRDAPKMTGGRTLRRLRPSVSELEERVVPSFPGVAGIMIDGAGDVFVSYDDSGFFTGQQQAIAEVPVGGFSQNIFQTTGSQAFPGALATVGSSAALPRLAAGAILELQPDGELFDVNPATGTSGKYDNLAGYTPDASHVYDVQTHSAANLGGTIPLSGATFGDFGIFGSSLVVAGESNNWDFVMRLTYGAQGGTGTATILAASPIPSGALNLVSPQGVAVDSQGTVLATLPVVPGGSSTAVSLPVGFSLFYDQGQNPQPTLPSLGLSAPPDLESTAITVDAQDNFLLALAKAPFAGVGPGGMALGGVAHINSALTAFLADPIAQSPRSVPSAIAYQNVNGRNELAFTLTSSFDPALDTFTTAGELSLFSGQVTPAMLRHAYGIDQISFPGAGGTTIKGDGTGQTIAIVEEGSDPTVEADLHTFDQLFGIPDPPSFQEVNQNGVNTPDAATVGETSLDVEWAHATAPGASIVVYDAAYYPNAPTTSLLDLFTSMHLASLLPGVSVVTLSYGIPEADLAGIGPSEQQLDSNFATPGVTFLASSGDFGIFSGDQGQVDVEYPAASPNVVAVGGTSVTFDTAGDYPGTGTSGEVGWGEGANSATVGGSGGGLSANGTPEPEPSWQTGVVSPSVDRSGTRAVPDVALDAGSIQPYDVFTSTLTGSSVSPAAAGWLGDAGTSASAPIWAGLIAIANQGRALQGGTPLTGASQTLPALYSLPAADFHDITSGGNGDFAGPGYDLVTGLGTPLANRVVPDLAGYQLASQLAIKAEPPSSVAADSPFSLKVAVEDRAGSVVAGTNDLVTIALAGASANAILSGTATEPTLDGIATFSGLIIGPPGPGYTLTATASGVAGTATTTAITVTPPSSGKPVVLVSSPTAPVYGQKLTLTAVVNAATASAGAPTGSVTFEEGTTNLGTEPLVFGIASVSMTPSVIGSETITAMYSGDANNPAASATLPVTVGQAPTRLVLIGLSVTYDGSPQSVGVTTLPAGIAGVTVSYTQNGVPLASPTQAGSYTVTATLENPDYTAPAATGTLVIAAATPVITWANPASIMAGTPLGPGQLDAAATFNGLPLAGTLTYTPPAGSVLAPGNGQLLTVTFTPADSQDFQVVTATVRITVSSPSTTALPVIVESIHWETRKVARRKTVHVLILGFSGPLEPGSARDLNNYALFAVEKARKPGQRKDKPIALASASYGPTPGTVTLSPRGMVPNQRLHLVIQTGGILDAEGNPIGPPSSSVVVTLSNKGGISLVNLGR
jgi:hypothetical protein